MNSRLPGFSSIFIFANPTRSSDPFKSDTKLAPAMQPACSSRSVRMFFRKRLQCDNVRNGQPSTGLQNSICLCDYPFPTLIFLDLKMPGLDGFAVLQHLKANTTWAIIPAIVFSASEDSEDITKAFLCGACAYHVKPRGAEDREHLCRVLLEYWSMSEVPQIDDPRRARDRKRRSSSSSTIRMTRRVSFMRDRRITASLRNASKSSSRDEGD